jgi:hypothetical protein
MGKNMFDSLLKPEFAWFILAMFALNYLRDAARHLDRISDNVVGLRNDLAIYVSDSVKRETERDGNLLDAVGKLEEISGHTYSLTTARD